jgi:ATP-binding cassette subfamily F protein 3
VIQFSAAGKRFGPKILFEELDWLITPNDRVGIVGANGTGKSTLLKVLAGTESLDYGRISLTKGMRLGYLPQDGLELRGRTVFAECMSVFANLLAMETEMEALAHQMSELEHDSPEYHDVADRFHRMDTEFRTRDGYAIEAQVGSVLSGLGFRKEDWKRLTDEFSGGWQMRIALAKLLLEKPNLLLLDEPTNHLDLEARNWLEEYLESYPNAVILISHDRYFLDVTVRRIAEIWNKRVTFYTGGYEAYVRQKDERKSQLEAAYKNQRDRIEQLEAFINRFRYKASKAKQVQSRIKELDRIERIEIPPEEKTIHFSFPQPKASGRIVAEFKNVSKSYGQKEVFSGVSFIIERGDRIALVGVNGAGKSTLIKLLSGAAPLSTGEYTLGHNAEPDYFAQDQYKELNTGARLIDDLAEVAPRATQTVLRSILGCFLFSEDDVFKRVEVLSGGERNRYALARMLMQPSNFLLLDEPTNHLDIRAKDVLLQSLQDYTGTAVFVSHDRYFIDRLATRVFEIEDGKLTVFPGNYEDYLRRKSGDSVPVPTLDLPAPVAPPVVKKAKRVNPIKVQQLEGRCQELEAGIARLEAEIAEGESGLAVFQNAEETTRLTRLIETQRTELEARVAEWEKVSAELEEVRSS